ncbi:uncharacterized protein ACNLHF_002704 isoform 2-T2 [Anomaloglossus baeobatrachus]|uniref:uncharacterized protein LOC142256153 n=1 Tax=Anomaloglossus baeobatrachus TaxID=238106 RepID=UPI003F500942
MREIAKKLKISYNGVYYSLQRRTQTANTGHRPHSNYLFAASSGNSRVMKSSCLLLICILWSISATDVNISCVHCVGETEKSCHGDLKECSSVTDQCISVFEEAKVDMKTSSLFMRFCGDCSQQKTGFVRFHNGILKINATCCNTSNCNPSVPTVPRDEPIKYKNVKKTGKICNSCYTYKVRKCDCKIYMECIEGEDSCISRYISATEPHDHLGAIRGCTTSKMCDVTNSTASISIGNNTIESNFSCSDESDSIHSSLWLPVLAAALLSKLPTVN